MTVCGRCGVEITSLGLVHQCFANYWMLPARMCACGQFADMTAPAIRYPVSIAVMP
jgi:hypothetical protein